MTTAILIVIGLMAAFMLLVIFLSLTHKPCYECQHNESCCKFEGWPDEDDFPY